MNSNQLTFEQVIIFIGAKMRTHQLINIKKSLLGHVDKESIDKIRNGNGLIATLLKNKLLHHRKLAFFRKLLQDEGDCDEFRKMIDVYKNFQKPVVDNTLTLEKEKQESLKMVEARLLMTLDDLKTNLEKTTLTMNEINRRKLNYLDEIQTVKDSVAVLKAIQDNNIKKYEEVKDLLSEKEKSLSMEKEKQATLEQLEKDLQTSIDDSMTKLKLTGKSRLNTFEKTFQKDKLRNAQQEKKDTSIKISEQVSLIVSIESDVDIVGIKKDLRRGKIRTKTTEITEGVKKLCDLYVSLRKVNEELLSVTNEMNAISSNIADIEDDLETTRDELKQVLDPVKSRTSDFDQKDSVNKIIAENRKDINYSLLGSFIYFICTASQGMQHFQLSIPVAVTCDNNGDILVADKGHKCLVLMNIYGELLQIIDTDTLQPRDVAIDGQNRYIVAGRSAIRIYENGILIDQFLPHYQTNTMVLPSIVSVTYNKYTKQIYILDEANLEIQVFDLNGSFLHIKNIFESITSPSRMAMLSEYSVVVTDKHENCYVIYNFLTDKLCTYNKFGSYGITNGEFVQPNGLIADNKGNIVICDTSNHRIQVFDENGACIAVRGRLGENYRCFHNPVDVAFHHAGFLIVADRNNRRIVFYS